jgi:hypothetical protein
MVAKSRPPRRREFTPGTAQCVVVTIRAVFDLSNFVENDGDASVVDDALERLRQYGAAEIIERMPVIENFEKASTILHTQKARKLK